jgi:uncharacterized protein YehS (DUF1456 family)
MTNNDVFRKIMHLTGVGRNGELAEELFKLGGVYATQSKIKGWRTSLDNSRASHMPDKVLEAFFQGLFSYRDKQRERGVNVFNFLDT